MLGKFSVFRSIVLAAFTSVVLAACTTSGGNQVNATLGGNQQAQPVSTTENQNALAAEPLPSPAEQATGIQTGQEVQTAALDTANAMTFLPIEGAPQGQMGLLSNSIRRSAVQQGLTVLPATLNGSAAYQVKGYFSALNDGAGTLLVYIWDVHEKSGRLLHRINGQERSSSTKTDPWQAISDRELTRVADNTAAKLKSFVSSQN